MNAFVASDGFHAAEGFGGFFEIHLPHIGGILTVPALAICSNGSCKFVYELL